MYNAPMQTLRAGDVIPVQARKADETVYRSWKAMVESVTDDLLVTIAPAGSSVFNIKGEDHPILNHYRAYYWTKKYYNLLEIFDPNGTLVQIYVNIAAPPEFKNGILSFKDHELDVSKRLPEAALLVDEDEFAEAVIKYGYSKEFQEKMYATARIALELAENWQAKPCPIFGDDHA